MKTLKKIGIGIVLFILCITLISLFFPTAVNVERSVSINASSSTIFPFVNGMHNWKKWGGPWHEEGMDFTKVIQRIEGPEYGIGSKLIYNQGKGEGSVEIIESEPHNSAKTLISFEDGGSANGLWSFTSDGNTTEVTWAIQVELGYNPIKRIMGNLMLDGVVGPLFETGLKNLKTISEQE